jgi:lysozyme
MRKLLLFLFIFISKWGKSQILGIDVSKYQGDIDWMKVDTSIKFVIAKKSEGLTIEDPKWCQNLLSCERPFGLYHFFRPQFSGIEQARKFLTGFNLTEIQIVPVIDVEWSKSWKITQYGVQNLQDMIYFIKDSVGVWPIIYTNSNFWNTKLCERLDLGECKLWIADWRKTEVPEVPEDFSDWVIWQWTSLGRISGIRGYVDLDRVKNLEDILISK